MKYENPELKQFLQDELDLAYFELSKTQKWYKIEYVSEITDSDLFKLKQFLNGADLIISSMADDGFEIAWKRERQ